VPSGAQPTHRPPLSAPAPPRPPAPTARRADTDAAGSPRQTGGRARHPPPPDQPPAPRSPPTRVPESSADRGPWELPGHREGGPIPHGPAAQAAPPPPPPVGSLGSAPGRPPSLDPLSHLQPSANRSTLPATKTNRNGKAESETFPGRGSGGEETAGVGSADRNAPGPTAPCPAAKLDRSGRLRGARPAQTGGEIGGRAGLGGPGSRPAHPASSTAWS
jgi:hypothetical protein